MDINYKFKENYLSHRKYNNPKVVAVGMLALIIIISNIHWSQSTLFDFSANYNSVKNLDILKLITSSFIHADIKHLLSNSLMYFILTYFIYSFFGAFYSILLPVIAGTFINYVTLLYYGEGSSLIGASGIVYYMWGFWLYLYFRIQTQMSIMLRILRVGAIFLILLLPTQFDPNTSYFAHYFGFFTGLIIGTFYYFLHSDKIRQYTFYEPKTIMTKEIDLDYGEKNEDYSEYY